MSHLLAHATILGITIAMLVGSLRIRSRGPAEGSKS